YPVDIPSLPLPPCVPLRLNNSQTEESQSIRRLSSREKGSTCWAISRMVAPGDAGGLALLPAEPFSAGPCLA
ncbi:hypothetical protein AVEN_157366-2-1, partial [Araneus ventricosus]